MLLFAQRQDNPITQCDDQPCKYTEVKHGEYAGDGVYVAKGVYLPKIDYSEYAEDSMGIAKGEYGKHAKDAAFVEEGNNNPLATMDG
jgi:hypothetical protein